MAMEATFILPSPTYLYSKTQLPQSELFFFLADQYHWLIFVPSSTDSTSNQSYFKVLKEGPTTTIGRMALKDNISPER